jgi:PPE-repeat protein
MDYGALPPEVNSARMYTGPGSEPMLTAAAAWTTLADELRSIATGYSSTISTLGTAWQGSASARMTAAAVPYITWLTTTAEHAQQTAIQAKAAANSYETAFAATVPPPTIAANRAQLASLVSTNIVGQNTAAIASTEADYVDMWAQDTAAMYVYAGQSATAAHVTPFNPPPHTTNPAATTAQTTLPGLLSTTPNALQSLATPTTNSASATGLADLVNGLNSSPLAMVAQNVEVVSDAILPANSALINTIMGLGIGGRGFDMAIAAGGGAGASALKSAGLATVGSTVSAGVGQAGSVGGLAVPSSWAAATPAIRTAAAVLSGTADGAVAATAVSQGSLLTEVVSAGTAGCAIGAAIPRTTATEGRGAVLTARTNLKDNNAPENLQRLVAQMAEKSETVQHWRTDPENLDSLLDQLRKKPGTHAVHVRNEKPKLTPPKSQPI